MKIYDLEMYNFRNYHKQKVILGESINFFIGENGSGKTNFLESIYFLALTKSYKTNEINLIRNQAQFFRVQAKFESGELINSAKIVMSKSGKKIVYNGNEVKKISDYIGKLNVLSFLPEDISLIKNSPKERRYFIDLVLGQIDKNYLSVLTSYKKILKQRNEILKGLSEKGKYDFDLLDIITKQLSDYAESIVNYRKQFVKDINYYLNSAFYKISGSKSIYKFIYEPSVAEDFYDLFKAKYKTDIQFKMTNYGPHRDEYIFEIDGFNARDISSQGEQRIIIIALILAIAEIINSKKNEWPILLLDDIFSELDKARQNRLIQFINASKMQVILTSTSINEIKKDILDKSKIFIVENDNIKEVEKIGQ